MWFLDFLSSLRKDYLPLSPNDLQHELDLLMQTTMADVRMRLSTAGTASIAFDGWSAQHRLPVLGWTVKAPGQPSVLWKLEQVQQSQTASFLQYRVAMVVEELRNLGVKVVAVVADGAANFQKALKPTG